jgi:hypothetical protein
MWLWREWLGFYHIPHAPLTATKSENRTILVTVQGGCLTILQLVAELSRLIPEKWIWNVTQQDTNSFVVPFPSGGSLQRSVALGSASIKEHVVNLIFEEWQPDEEGQQLPRVWIRIYRLPKQLREFSVLWALWSMLGATQSVDMISSLRNDYGQVEVVVLSVDLLPNSIDSVIIGDRLYTLPIHVEGRDEVDIHAHHMEVDDGNNGVEGSGEQEQRETRDSPNNSTQEKEQGRENSTQDKHPDRDNQPSDLEVQGVIAEELCGNAATNFCFKTDAPHFNLSTGNGELHLSQLASNLCGVDCHVNETPNLKSSHVNPLGHESE